MEFSSPSDQSLIFVILVLCSAKEALQLFSLLTFFITQQSFEQPSAELCSLVNHLRAAEIQSNQWWNLG